MSQGKCRKDWTGTDQRWTKTKGWAAQEIKLLLLPLCNSAKPEPHLPHRQTAAPVWPVRCSRWGWRWWCASATESPFGDLPEAHIWNQWVKGWRWPWDRAAVKAHNTVSEKRAALGGYRLASWYMTSVLFLRMAWCFRKQSKDSSSLFSFL